MTVHLLLRHPLLHRNPGAPLALEVFMIAALVLLGVFSLLGLVAALFIHLSRAGTKLLRAQEARLMASRRAQATVLSASPGVSTLSEGGLKIPEIVLRLSVEGREVTTRWHVLPLGLAKVQEGAVVPVRIDAQDPAVVYPGRGWARFSFLDWPRVLEGKSAP